MNIDKIGARIVHCLKYVTLIMAVIIASALTIGGCLGLIGFHW